MIYLQIVRAVVLTFSHLGKGTVVDSVLINGLSPWLRLLSKLRDAIGRENSALLLVRWVGGCRVHSRSRRARAAGAMFSIADRCHYRRRLAFGIAVRAVGPCPLAGCSR